MTTDRELLELAAKAAGVEYRWDSDALVEMFANGHAEWNPLTDDGDALRLAVKMEINLRKHYYEGDYFIQASHHTGWASESEKPDPYAATRRAIVRAAAEIGEAV